MKFLNTSGGAHAPDSWAMLSAGEILDLIKIDPQSDSGAARAARLAKEDIRPKLIRTLTDHYSAAQDDERGMARDLSENLDPMPKMKALNSALDAIMKGTPFAAHFKTPDTRETVRRIVGQHTADVMHIERRYHADRQQKVA